MKKAIIYRYDGERKTLYRLEPVRDQGYIMPDGEQYFAPSTATNTPLEVELPEGVEVAEAADGSLALWAGNSRLEIIDDDNDSVTVTDGSNQYKAKILRTLDWSEVSD
jgi:hypothetical protein